jgi:hypothetical protein
LPGGGRAHRSALVELEPEVGIDQQLVGLRDLCKPDACARIIRLLVRMPELGELPVGALDFFYALAVLLTPSTVYGLRMILSRMGFVAAT